MESHKDSMYILMILEEDEQSRKSADKGKYWKAERVRSGLKNNRTSSCLTM